MTHAEVVEPCACGSPHPSGAEYFVSAVDAGRTAILAGPYASHHEALAALPSARLAAERIDAWSHFYAFGTCAIPVGSGARGSLNHLIGGAQ